MKPKGTKIIYVTDDLAQKSAAFLNSFATLRPSEGVVYWFGIEDRNCAVVTTLIVPDADTVTGCVKTSLQANAAAVRAIAGTPLVYIGQAHSHPGSGVSHSQIDDEEAFARFDGAISIVIPWFGRYGFDLKTCGVYRHVSGGFRRVHDVSAHIQILPGDSDLRENDGIPEGS